MWFFGEAARERRSKARLERSLAADAREKLRDIEAAMSRLSEQVAATRDNAQDALKLLRQVETQGVQLSAVKQHVSALQEALETGLQEAHQTARQALNVTKGGTRGGAQRELAAFGQQIQELSATAEGRAHLIQQLKDAGTTNGAAPSGTGILGLG